MIVAGNFGGTAAVTAVLTFGIFEIVGSLLLALAFGRAKLRSIWLNAHLQ
jgi:type IV secretory pathway VirB2 component (pilin)